MAHKLCAMPVAGMITQVEDLLARATYYHCVLLVHTDVARLERAVRELSAASGWHVVSVGRILAGALLSTPPLKRPFAARDSLGGVLAKEGPGPLICTDIDLLFEPSLNLDPYLLLRDASRTTALVVAWLGSYSDGALAYAVPEHARYRTWQHPEVQIHLLNS